MLFRPTPKGTENKLSEEVVGLLVIVYAYLEEKNFVDEKQVDIDVFKQDFGGLLD